MEAAAGVAVSLPMPSSRREWRVVSEHQSVQNAGDENLEGSKLGHSDERTIYEQGQERVDLSYCSINIDGGVDNGDIQQQLHSVARQREELQHIEMDLRAQAIARSRLMGMQNRCDAQIKEHANALVKLREELHEREQAINELERKMEDKERELHEIKLANEAAWAKEDLLREQNKELASFRREYDNYEAERAQHLNQIHDLQEHIQDKERQFIEMQEQNRVAQETIIYKDEQLREAQAWISRFQEVDVLQTHLQAELRERTEQYNQLWLACQRQFAEMERVHVHTVQQLQLELAEAREKIGTYADESNVPQKNAKEAPQYRHDNGHQLEANAGVTPSENPGVLPNSGTDNNQSFVSANQPTQTNHVPVVPSSVLGLPPYLPPGQVTALHQFIMHQQGVPHSAPSHVPQSDAAHAGQFHSIPAITQHWPNQQGVSGPLQVPAQNQFPPSQTDPNLIMSDGNLNYDISANGQPLHPDYLNVRTDQVMDPNSVIKASTESIQVAESKDRTGIGAPQPQQSLEQISSQFHKALSLDSLDQNIERKESVSDMTNHGVEPLEPNSAAKSAPDAVNSVNRVETSNDDGGGGGGGQTNSVTAGKASEVTLLDERSLLACIVRTIPPGSGGRIRISSTLPNRLGKMLAPLHWHDYKKMFGKLDEFVASHSELFVVDGDHIQLREGAQEIIAATAAVAKVAAAASASSPYSSLLPSVAVTPVAQSHRLKKVPPVDSKSLNTNKTILKDASLNSTDNGFRVAAKQNQYSNGVHANVAGSSTSIKILNRPKDSLESNVPGNRVHSSPVTNGNGANSVSSQKKASVDGRPVNFSTKQQGRLSGQAATSRR